MLQTGMMREKIELLSKTQARNTHGQVKDEFVSLGTLRAQLIKDSSAVSYSEKRDNKITTLVFLTRKDSRLHEGQPVHYHSDLGYITAMESLRQSREFQITIEIEK